MKADDLVAACWSSEWLNRDSLYNTTVSRCSGRVACLNVAHYTPPDASMVERLVCSAEGLYMRLG